MKAQRTVPRTPLLPPGRSFAGPLLFVVALVGAACATSPPSEVEAPSDKEQLPSLQARLEASLPSPLGTAVSTSVVLGEERATAVRGERYADGPAVDAETRFNVASVSKLLTAARVVSLAHAGTFSLDDSVAEHLPGVRLLDEHGGDHAQTITLRDLLQHTSGLPHFPADLGEKVDGRWQEPRLLSAVTDAWDIPLVRPLGQYGYSNLGYALLGAIVERRAQCPFATCMQEYLDDLGMTGATFWPADLPDNAAHGRVQTADGPTFHPPAWYTSRFAIPYSGLWTSMPDLARFGVALLEAAEDPAAPLHEMTKGEGHGLGPVHGIRLEAASLEHDGSGPGFHAALVVVPSHGVVLALATNGGDETREQSQAFEAGVGQLLHDVMAP